MTAKIPSNTLEKFTTFGDLLRFLRRRAGLTQMELATEVGYSDAQISRLEQNLRLPDIPTIEARFIPVLDLESEPRAAARLLDLAANVRREDAPVVGLSPYKGLNYFDEPDADLFVGREALTTRLVARVQALHQPGDPAGLRFLAVVGASGSGKSSLVRAGLVPALRWHKTSANWRILVLTPTARPLESLAHSLVAEGGTLAATASLIDDLAQSPRSLHLFATRESKTRPGARLLLVVDQFEELFTLCRSEAERSAFINNLFSAASEMSGPTLVLITLRADFYAQCAAYPSLRGALAQHQEYIGTMTTDELRRAIQEPARRGRWEIEAGLVDLLLREIGNEPGALPLLSHALLETWQRRRGRTLTLSGYTASGGVRGAIAETAETVLIDQFTPQQRAIARRIFLRLTEFGDEGSSADTRRRVAYAELILNPEETADTQEVLKALADARLISTGQETVEVAHEALIREWPTLRGWLEENREGLRLHRRLTEASQEWLAHDRVPDGLYRGARLVQVIEWAQGAAGELNSLEREFLQASRDLAECEAREREALRQRELEAAHKLVEAERRRTFEQAQSANLLRRRSSYLAGAFIVAVALAMTAGFLWYQGRLANQVALARELAAAAISNLEVDPERSLLLALQANTRAETLEGESALHQALLASRLRLTIQVEDVGAAVQVQFSPDGRRLASTNQEQEVQVWDAASGALLFTVTGRYSAFSPDGKTLATILSDNRVQLWEAESGTKLLTHGRIEATTGLAFSPDGERLATVAFGNLVKLWDLSSGAEIRRFSGHRNYVSLVFFNPDGDRLLTASDDGTARLWDVETGAEILQLSGHPDWVLCAGFNPDGSRIVTLSQDQAVVWETASGARLLTLPDMDTPLFAATFSPDGALLAVGGQDRRARLWEVSTGREVLTLSGHSGAIISLSFSPDGQRLATGSTDGSLRVWDLTPAHEALTLTPLPGPSQFIEFTPDGGSLLGSAGELAMLWEAGSGSLQQTYALAGTQQELTTALATSRDGAWLARAGEGAQISLWDVHTGKQLQAWRAHTGRINALAIHPATGELASASDDYKLKIWLVDLAVAAPEQPASTLDFSTQVKSLAYNPQGTQLAAGLQSGVVKVIDPASGAELFSLRGHSVGVVSVAYSPDGERLATAGQDGSLKIWNAQSGKLVLSPGGHPDTVMEVSFSPDGKRLATASRDGTVRLWGSTSGIELLTLYGDGSGLNHLDFSPDGKRLAVSSDTAIWVYLLDRQELLELAHSRVTRLLTDEECQKYLHGDSPDCAPPRPVFSSNPLSSSDKGRICQATQEGGLFESYFNRLMYQGLQQAAGQYRWEPTALESASLADVEKNLAILAGSECELIATAGPFVDAIAAAARANPEQRFLTADFWTGPLLENVWVQTYAVDQAAFLAGYAAASATRTGKVGTFGGIDIPQVTNFMDGFALGVAYYNRQYGTEVALLGWDVQQHQGLFVGGFCCSEEGQAMAQELLLEGVDILMPVAGESVGWGAGVAVQEHGDAWLIGVDTDWRQSAPDLEGVVWTSIEKRFDVSVVSAAQAIVEGRFSGGYHIGDLETGEVALSDFHPTGLPISSEVQAEMKQIAAAIMAGEIITRP